MQHLGGGLAPWNIQQYDFYLKGTQLFGREIKTKKEFKVIFYHFHALNFLNNNKVNLVEGYEISENVINAFYKPYLRHLEKIKRDILSVDSSFDPHVTITKKKNLRKILGFIKKRMMGIKNNQNIYDISNLKGGTLWRKL